MDILMECTSSFCKIFHLHTSYYTQSNPPIHPSMVFLLRVQLVKIVFHTNAGYNHTWATVLITFFLLISTTYALPLIATWTLGWVTSSPSVRSSPSTFLGTFRPILPISPIWWLYNVLITELIRVTILVLTRTALFIAGYISFVFSFAIILSTTLCFDAYSSRDPVATSTAATAQTKRTP